MALDKTNFNDGITPYQGAQLAQGHLSQAELYLGDATKISSEDDMHRVMGHSLADEISYYNKHSSRDTELAGDPLYAHRPTQLVPELGGAKIARGAAHYRKK